jgi:hypothetical protein
MREHLQENMSTEGDILLTPALLDVSHSEFRRAQRAEPWSLVYKGRSNRWELFGLHDAWCPERLRALGYWVREDKDPRRREIRGGKREWQNMIEEMLFAWRSVMADDEVRAMQERARARWSQRRSQGRAIAAVHAGQR